MCLDAPELILYIDGRKLQSRIGDPDRTPGAPTKIQPQLPVSVPEVSGAAGGGGSACSPPEIVSQHEPEADYQDANSDAHQHESGACGPEWCTPPCPPQLVRDGCGPDRAGHPRRVIGSAPRENKRVLCQFSKSPAALTRIIEGGS